MVSGTEYNRPINKIMPFTIEYRDYSPTVYSNLHELDSIEGLLPNMQSAITAINAVIASHGVANLLGASLLHKHFELYEDERLLRTRRDDSIAIRPVSRDVELSCVPFIWAFGKTKIQESYGLYPVEYFEEHESLKQFLPAIELVTKNGDFLLRIFRILSSTGLTTHLGLGLNVGALFSYPEKHQLMETEHPLRGARSLELRVRPEGSFPNAKIIQTLWLHQE